MELRRVRSLKPVLRRLHCLRVFHGGIVLRRLKRRISYHPERLDRGYPLLLIKLYMHTALLLAGVNGGSVLLLIE